jgi:hypothetical protein
MCQIIRRYCQDSPGSRPVIDIWQQRVAMANEVQVAVIGVGGVIFLLQLMVIMVGVNQKVPSSRGRESYDPG